VVEACVRELLEAVSQYDDTAGSVDLQIQLNMPVTEDIVIMVVAQLLLLFGKQH
jgi:hypothetical protein